LAAIESVDGLAAWAHRALPIRNRLTTEDAQAVDVAFVKHADRLQAPPSDDIKQAPPPTPDSVADLRPSKIRPDETPEASSDADEGSAPAARRRRARTEASDIDSGAPPKIDKSVLTFPEPRRIRDKHHLKFVGSQPCLICGRAPSDAHHIRFAQPRALGRKVSDEFTLPLCRTHHRQVHQTGNEASWWQKNGIDPLSHARALWSRTRPAVNGHLEDATPTHDNANDFERVGPRQ
jgi:hypothetical protein